MIKTATITSKRQLTIPSSMFKKAGLKKGQKVIVGYTKKKLYLEPAIALVESLAGSVKTPKSFRNLSTDKIIQKAKKGHFKQR